jgi:hypothetical protein
MAEQKIKSTWRENRASLDLVELWADDRDKLRCACYEGRRRT